MKYILAVVQNSDINSKLDNLEELIQNMDSKNFKQLIILALIPLAGTIITLYVNNKRDKKNSNKVGILDLKVILPAFKTDCYTLFNRFTPKSVNFRAVSEDFIENDIPMGQKEIEMTKEINRQVNKSLSLEESISVEDTQLILDVFTDHLKEKKLIKQFIADIENKVNAQTEEKIELHILEKPREKKYLEDEEFYRERRNLINKIKENINLIHIKLPRKKNIKILKTIWMRLKEK